MILEKIRENLERFNEMEVMIELQNRLQGSLSATPDNTHVMTL